MNPVIQYYYTYNTSQLKSIVNLHYILLFTTLLFQFCFIFSKSIFLCLKYDGTIFPICFLRITLFHHSIFSIFRRFLGIVLLYLVWEIAGLETAMKILLLEDDKYLCSNIKQQLTKEGYIVDARNDGEEELNAKTIN